MEERLPDFTDKSVVFNVTMTSGMPAWMGDGIVLQSPVFERHEGRLFVLGRTPKDQNDSNDWSSNRQAALAWDSVVYYVVVPSDEYEVLRNVQPDTTATEVPVHNRQPERKLAAKFSLILIGLIIPIALFIGIVLWIVKMLLN